MKRNHDTLLENTMQSQSLLGRTITELAGQPSAMGCGNDCQQIGKAILQVVLQIGEGRKFYTGESFRSRGRHS